MPILALLPVLYFCENLDSVSDDQYEPHLSLLSCIEKVRKQWQSLIQIALMLSRHSTEGKQPGYEDLYER